MNEGPSSSERPEILTKGGRGSYCCIPNCGSATYNANREKTGIGLFTFPKDPKRRQTWKRVVNLYRRKGANDNFKITNNTRICEFHFKPKFEPSSKFHWVIIEKNTLMMLFLL